MVVYVLLPSVYVAVIVMLSAYVMSCVLGGVGMSQVHMLKSVGKRKPLWGTQVLNWHVDVFLKVVQALHSLM